ncbi:DUF2254 domain-containing protein [Streptomyces sp. PmtG]
MAMSGRGLRRHESRVSEWGERARESFLLVPLSGMAGGIALAFATAAVDADLSARPWVRGDSALQAVAEPSKAVIAAVGPAMLTFLGVVFSITLVALQMAAGQFSPRITRVFLRSTVTKATLAVFIGTFVYTLEVQYIGHAGSTQDAAYVPVVSGVTTMSLVSASVVMFVIYVNHTVHLMRVSDLIDRVTAESLRGIHALHRPAPGPPPPADAPGRTVRYTGRPGVLRGISHARLVRLAARQDAVVTFLPRTGDFLAPGAPLCRIQSPTPFSASAVQRCLEVGAERSMRQDVAFGLRQLADIAVRALAPGVNDATTAVQALDRIHVLLDALAHAPLQTLHYADSAGTVRVVVPLPDWDAVLGLALTEILLAAPGEPQVTRRMAAALNDLAAHAPAERRPAVEWFQATLRTSVTQAFPDPDLRAFALTPDRQGIG